MTVTSEIASITYPGDGVATVWAYDFIVPSNTDGSAQVQVFWEDDLGHLNLLSPSVFTITGLDNPAGGLVIYPTSGSPISSLEKISIVRDANYTQVEAVSNQAFYPHTLESMTDKLTLQTQDLNDRSLRSIIAPPGEFFTTYLPNRANRANKVLGFDSAGELIATTGSGGGGGSTLWNDLVGVPTSIELIAALTPAAGKIIEFTGSGSAHLINTPSGTVTSVNGFIGAVVLSYIDVGAAASVHNQSYTTITNFGTGVNAALAAGTNVTLSFASGITTINATGGGGGSMQPALMSTFAAIDGGGVNTANNNSAVTGAEADSQSAFYWPDGVYAMTKNPAAGDLTKGYKGRGVLLNGTSAYPAKFSYMLTKPTTWPTQGATGWFRGDQRFGDGGEYKWIGPSVRSFDVTTRYFESNTIPHHAWMTTDSGNSGVQAFLTSGANPGMGTLIPLANAASASWVGKTVAFAANPDGTATDTKTVTAVNTAGNNITINSALANTYVWNPSIGSIPCIYFAHRTWSGHEYRKLTTGADGGGDVYGTIWRTNNNYVPKATETHPFMTSTAGQAGGDQYSSNDGVYQTSWENLQSDQPGATAADISSIQFVLTQVRHNDLTLQKGRFWTQILAKNEGNRPVDGVLTVLGQTRRVVDTVIGDLIDTEYLLDPTTAAGTAIKVMGTLREHALMGDPLTIENPTTGAVLYTGAIDGWNGADSQILSVTPALPGTVIPAGSLVRFTHGGAAVNVGDNHRLMFGSTVNNSARSGYSLGAYPAFYGNVAGDFMIESGADGIGRKLEIRAVKNGFYAGGTTSGAATPDNARIRLRQGGTIQLFASVGVQMNGNLSIGGDFSVPTGHIINIGTNAWLVFNGSNILGTVNGGGSYTTLV